MAFDLRLPAGVTLGADGLGLETCAPAVLTDRGLSGCSAEAIVGHGSALADIALGSEVVAEETHITLLMAPITDGHTAILFYMTGEAPVITRLVFPSLLVGDSGVFGGRLEASIPPITTWAGGPDVAMERLTLTIGPEGITYYKHVHGTTIPYSPEGFTVPAHCPTGGFSFEALFSYEDGTNGTAKTNVPCPPHTKHRSHNREAE